MNLKKTNWMFVAIFFFYLALSLGLSFYLKNGGMVNSYVMYLINTLVYLVPMAVFLSATGTRLKDLLPLRKVKAGTIGMTALYAILCMPLTSVANLVTLFFVENTVEQSSDSIRMMPFSIAFLLIAVYAPLFEELMFRGVVTSILRKECNLFQTMILSALFFAMMHMNFNQAAYTFLVGVMLVLLREATGSIKMTFLFHMLFNGYNVVLMYLQSWLTSQDSELAKEVEVIKSQSKAEFRDALFVSIGVYMLLAAAGIALALCVLWWIAGHEGRKENLKLLLKGRKENRAKIWSLSFVIVLVLYFGFMIFDAVYLQ